MRTPRAVLPGLCLVCLLSVACDGVTGAPPEPPSDPALPSEYTLLFAVREPVPNLYLGTMRGDGSQRTLLTTASSRCTHGAWSPDGERIAFSIGPGQWCKGSAPFGIHVMTADGGNQTGITGGAYDFSPAWSPDGARIAFVREFFDWPYPNPSGEGLFVVGADGTEEARIFEGWPVRSPSWSADGSRITFRWNGDWHVIDAVPGSTPEPTDAPSGTEQISPDGRWLVVSEDGKIIVSLIGGMFSKEIGTGSDPRWRP